MAFDVLKKLKGIKTPKILKPLFGNLLLKREPEYGKPMTFPVGAGMSQEQTQQAEKVLKPLGGFLLKTTKAQRFKRGEQVFKTGETGKPFLPELAPKQYVGKPGNMTDFVANVVLNLPEATFKTLPFIKLLREPAPTTFEGRAKAIGNEAIDFVRGIGQLAITPGISAISLLKDEPIEKQVKTIPFLGEVPTYERQAYEQLIMGVSPLEVGISLGAQAAITAGIVGAPAVKMATAFKPKLITKTTKVSLTRKDISDITRDVEVNPQTLKAFKQAVQDGVEIGNALRAHKPVIVKMETPSVIGEILYRPVSKGMFERIIPKAQTPVAGRSRLPGLVPMETKPAFGMRGLEIQKMKPVGKDIALDASKLVKAVEPIKDLTPIEQKVYEAEMMKEILPEMAKIKGQLFKDIKDLGGIKSYSGKFMAEELRPVPLVLKNNKTGMPLDEMAMSLKEKGYDFDGDADLLGAILKIKTEGKSEIASTIKTLKSIEKKMPDKAAAVSRRLLNKLYRLKYPKIPAEVKSVRRAIESGRISPEFEGKTITEMRRIKGFTNPKSVPTERLSIFNNFINLNKIKRKNVPYKQMGIAEIIRGDKTFPAIRQQSGFYAEKEIQTALIRDEYSQFLSPYHMALKQDGYKLGGKFGVMFQKVWKPTEKAIKGEKEFANIYSKTIRDLGTKYKIKTDKKNLERLSDVVERKVKAQTPEEELFILAIRKVLNDVRLQANDIRQKMRKTRMGYIENYIPHIQKATLWNEMLSNQATISDNLDFIVPNQVKNPFSFKRLFEEMPVAERNLYILLDRYIRAISKDIYITPAIENIKVYNSVLKNRGLINAGRYWDEYIRTGLIGKQHKIDTAISIGQTGRRRLQKWNDMVNKAFLTGKVAWNIATQPLSYIMNVPMEAGVKNSIKAIYKAFHKPLREYVRENSKVLAIKSGDVHAIAVGEGRNIQNRIYRTKIDKYNDVISMLGAIEERALTMASYIAGLERAKELKYKGQDALDFADLTAARTQSMYNKENRALVLNSDIARTMFPFQSFSVEMFNHLKEITTKASGAERLNYRQRFGKLFGLLVGLYLANWYSEKLTGKKKTTVGTFFPFLGSFVDILYAKAIGKQYYGGRSPITVFQISEDIITGSRNFIEYGDTKKLRKVGVNFGLALGGIGGGGQINNLIDGIMVNIDGDVKNVSGNVMFSVEDTLSKIIAPIFGVWATKEGREYWEPKEKEEEFKPIRGKSRLETKTQRKGKSRLGL